MNAKTYAVYVKGDVEGLIDENIRGLRNIGTIMSRISPLTSALGVDTYETAKELIRIRKGAKVSSQLSKTQLAQIEAIKRAMSED